MSQTETLPMLKIILLLLLASAASVAEGSSCSRSVCPNNTDWCHRFHLVSSTPPACNSRPSNCQLLNLTTLQLLRSRINEVLNTVDGSYWVGAVSTPSASSIAACWSYNLSLVASIPITGGSTGQVATVTRATTGLTYSFEPNSATNKAICEVPITHGSTISASDKLCYSEISKCFFVAQTAASLSSHMTSCGGQSLAKVATAANSTEESALVDYMNYLPVSTAKYFIGAFVCSQPYTFNTTSEVLGMMETWNFSTGKIRDLNRHSCAMIDASNSLTWDSCPANPDKYICYEGIPMASNDQMCQGTYCHNFWPMAPDPGVSYEQAKQKCNSSMPMREGLVELLGESALLPFRVVNSSSSSKYFAGIRKAAGTLRRFFWNSSTYANLSLVSGYDTANAAKHCVIATKSGSITYRAEDCTVAVSTKLICDGTVVGSVAPRTFKQAEDECRAHSREISSSDSDFNTHLTTESAWVNAFEYQAWNWTDNQPVYGTKNSVGDALAAQLLRPPNVLFNQAQCVFIQVTSINNAANISLVVEECLQNVSVACQFNSTRCSGIPSYNFGYISGTVTNNQTDSSFSVDILNGSCPLDLSTPFPTQSAVFFSCIDFNTTFLGNETTMIQSQCSLSGSGPAWSPIMNSNLCMSNFCDSRSIVDFNYPNNMKYLSVYAADNSTVSSAKPYIANGTKMTLSCSPGAMLVKVDDNFEKGSAISNEVTCLQTGWTYSVASFSNSTTIQVCDKTTTDTKLLKCQPIKCNVSDFKYLKSVNDRIGRLFLNQNESLTVNCTTNTSAVFNLNPILNIQCILVNDYTYGYAISNTFMGVNYVQVWNNSNITTLDETIEAVCRSAEFPACPRNESWLSEMGLEIASLSTTWTGYDTSSSKFPPNSTLGLRCVAPRVSDRLWTSIGEISTVRCPVNKTDAKLQWERTGLSCNYNTCPSPESLFPEQSIATGLKSNLSDTWVTYQNSSKFPPASQVLINCSLDVSVFQILYCNDSGQWVPVQYSYVNDTLDLCIGSYINCSMTTTAAPTTTPTTPSPTTTLVVETTTQTPTETTTDTTTVTSDSTTVTVEITSSTIYATTTQSPDTTLPDTTSVAESSASTSADTTANAASTTASAGTDTTLFNTGLTGSTVSSDPPTVSVSTATAGIGASTSANSPTSSQVTTETSVCKSAVLRAYTRS